MKRLMMIAVSLALAACRPPQPQPVPATPKAQVVIRNSTSQMVKDGTNVEPLATGVLSGTDVVLTAFTTKDPSYTDVAVLHLSSLQSGAVVGKVVLAVNSGTYRESWSSGTNSSPGNGGIINVGAFDGGEISVTVAGVPMWSTISDGGVASGTFTLDLEFSRQNLR